MKSTKVETIKVLHARGWNGYPDHFLYNLVFVGTNQYT